MRNKFVIVLLLVCLLITLDLLLSSTCRPVNNYESGIEQQLQELNKTMNHIAKELETLRREYQKRR